MSRIDRLMESQAKDLDRLTDRQARDVLAAYEDARRDLKEQIQVLEEDNKDGRFTIQHLRVVRAQVEQGIERLRVRLGVLLDESTAETERVSREHLMDVLRAQEPDFIDAGNRIDLEIVTKLAARRGLLLHKYSADRYAADLLGSIQRGLVLGQTTGQTFSQMSERIAGKDGSIIAGGRARVNLIVRMENMRAYDEAHRTGLEVAAEVLDADGENDDDPLLQRVDEFLDKRNHPFSRAANNVTAKIGEPWRVPVAEVEAAAKALGKSSTGVLWPREGAFYVGSQLPAHFHDRARRTAWRASWGTGGV